MIYRLIAFFGSLSGIVRDAQTLRRSMNRRYGWMPE